MGEQIIRQPGGLYAVHSTVTDTIIKFDATDVGIVNHYVGQTIARETERIVRILAAVERGEPERVYHQFALSWEDALAADAEHGGRVRATLYGDQDGGG